MDETIVSAKLMARRGLAVYFAVLIPGSAFLEWKILQTGVSINHVQGWIVVLMFMPAVASVMARCALHEGIRDISLRWGGREGSRAALLGWFYPLAVGLLAYGIAWWTGLAGFQLPLSARSHLYSNSAIANFAASLLLTATVGTVIGCLAAFGEEVGWRGFMLTRLITSGVRKPVLISGLIWGAWHVPIILSGQYAAGSRPWLSSILFVIGTAAMGYLAAYVRLRSGSIWPAVINHGAWNAIIQGTFDRATTGTPVAVGESGWITLIFTILVMLVMTRGVWTLRRQPSESLPHPFSRTASLLTL